MPSSRTGTPRGRYREQVFAEIKEHAWRQIAESGVAALSLNAIARQMGISGPALYRYFDSRNALVSALVADAYRMVHDAVRAAVAQRGNTPNVVAHAVRDWALAHPHRYFLIFGTPLPDYHAPAEMTDLARNVMALILTAVASANSPSDATGTQTASGALDRNAVPGSVGDSAVSGSVGESAVSGSVGESAVSGPAGDSAVSGLVGETAASGQLRESAASGALEEGAVSGPAVESAVSGPAVESAASGALEESAASGLAGDSAVYGPTGEKAVSGSAGASAASGTPEENAASGATDGNTVSGRAGESAASGPAGKSAASGSVEASAVSGPVGGSAVSGLAGKGAVSGPARVDSGSGPAAVLDAHLADHRAWTENMPVPVEVARVGLTLWTRLHGVLSLELAGHFEGMGFDPAVLFQAEVDSVVG